VNQDDRRLAYVGVDPGVSGAVAAIYAAGDSVIAGSIAVWDMPTVPVLLTTKTKSGKKRMREEIVVAELVRIFDVFARTSPVVLEKIQPMPPKVKGVTGEAFQGRGAIAAMMIGRSAGLVEGVLAALGFSYTLVSPQTWKKAMLAGTSRDKGAAIVRACQMFPAFDGISLKKHHGRAEALLMAAWASQHDAVVRGGFPRAD